MLRLHVAIYLPECSLPTHVNFDSAVLSGLDFSSRLLTFTEGSGSCVRFCHVFVRAHVDGPGSQPTHRRIGPHFACIPCSHARFGSASTACVSSPKRLGCLHGLAKAPPATRSFCLNTIHIRKPRSTKLAIISLKHSCLISVQRVFSAPPGSMLCRAGITCEIDSCGDFGGSLNYRTYSKNGKRATDK